MSAMTAAVVGAAGPAVTLAWFAIRGDGPRRAAP